MSGDGKKTMDAEQWAKDLLKKVKEMGEGIEDDVDKRFAPFERRLDEVSAQSKLALAVGIIGLIGALVAAWPWYKRGNGAVKAAINDFADTVFGADWRVAMAMGAKEMSSEIVLRMKDNPQVDLELHLALLEKLSSQLDSKAEEGARPVIEMLKTATEALLATCDEIRPEPVLVEEEEDETEESQVTPATQAA